ncbi:MAG: alpha/beta hydrolase [Eubacteriales bacterium]|nr:alpha/beta hydrolase [Eubacteriales bacterium]
MRLSVDGLATNAQKLGESGEELLLLHGWGPRSVSLEKNMLPLGQKLKRRFRVSMLDFPGHGETPAQAGNWGVPEYAAWTLKAMDALGIARASLVAHSFGGRIALYLAAHHPDRVNRLVLTGCAGLREKRGIKAKARALGYKAARMGLDIIGKIPALKKPAEEAVDTLRSAMSSTDYLLTPENLRGSFSLIVRQDLRPLLHGIKHPTLLVWGENDQATPMWMGEAMAEEMPDATLLIYGGEDHWAYQNQAARFANAVEAFLEEDFPL